MDHIPWSGPWTSQGAVLRLRPLLPNHEAPVLTGQSPPHNSPRLFELHRLSNDPGRLRPERLQPPDNHVVIKPLHPAPQRDSQRINGCAGIPPPRSWLSSKLAGQAPPPLHLSTKGLDKPGEAPPPCFHKTRPTVEPWVTFPLPSTVHMVC